MKTLKSLFWGISCFLLAGTVTQAQMESRLNVATHSPNAEANIAVVDKFVDALLSADYETVKASVTDNYLSIDGGDSATIADVITSWTENHKANSDHTLNGFHSALAVNDGPQKGDWILFWGYASWKNKASNKEVGMPIHLVFLVQEGKIAFDAAYYDSMGIMEEMGFAIVPPEE